MSTKQIPTHCVSFAEVNICSKLLDFDKLALDRRINKYSCLSSDLVGRWCPRASYLRGSCLWTLSSCFLTCSVWWSWGRVSETERENMGGEISLVDFEGISVQYYNFALQNPCLLPDVGIDQSLLRYSGANSTAELQSFSNELINSVPDFVDKFGSAVAPLTLVPNAVGLGALVISMILEIIVKNTTEASEDSYSMMRRVFAEEKGSSVRDTMTEYVRRHRTFMKNEQRLRLELHRLEMQLSGHLTILRNSLLLDGHLTSRGFKIWVNGAFFHLQMLIHEARLNHQAGQLTPTQVDSINTYVDLYLQDLDQLLEKYKTYLTTVTRVHFSSHYKSRRRSKCLITNLESNCKIPHQTWNEDHCEGEALTKAYVNQIVSKYPPITELKSHFRNVKSSVNVLIKQHDTFSLW